MFDRDSSSHPYRAIIANGDVVDERRNPLKDFLKNNQSALSERLGAQPSITEMEANLKIKINDLEQLAKTLGGERYLAKRSSCRLQYDALALQARSSHTDHFIKTGQLLFKNYLSFFHRMSSHCHHVALAKWHVAGMSRVKRELWQSPVHNLERVRKELLRKEYLDRLLKIIEYIIKNKTTIHFHGKFVVSVLYLGKQYVELSNVEKPAAVPLASTVSLFRPSVAASEPTALPVTACSDTPSVQQSSLPKQTMPAASARLIPPASEVYRNYSAAIGHEQGTPLYLSSEHLYLSHN